MLESLPALIESVVAFITENAPEIIKAGAAIITNLILGLIGAIPDLILALHDIIIALAEGFNELAKMGIDIGLAFIKGIWEGFKSATDWIASQIQGWIDGIIDIFRSLIEGIVDLFKGIFGGGDDNQKQSSGSRSSSPNPRRSPCGPLRRWRRGKQQRSKRLWTYPCPCNSITGERHSCRPEQGRNRHSGHDANSRIFRAST